MQETILPDAQLLYEQTSSRVETETTASTRIPAPVILVLATTIVFGLFAHRWLARTHRRVNIGLIAGGLAIMVMVVWVGTALAVSTATSRRAQDTSADSLKTITNLAITAQQARADETLSLIRRGGRPSANGPTTSASTPCSQQLSAYLDPQTLPGRAAGRRRDAAVEVARGRRADQRLHLGGQLLQAATQVALGTGEDDSTPAFDKLEEALDEGIRASRDQLRSDIPQRPPDAVRHHRRRRRVVAERRPCRRAGTVAADE